MKILVLGGGGREHAIVWKLKQSPRVEKLWCAPGNGGIAQDAECLPVNLGDVAAMVALAEQLKPDLTVVGPEQPLVAGVADAFAARGLAILGPTQAAARLEGSKVFAKQFMQRHGIPTAAVYGIYDAPAPAYSALCAVDWPMVIKADGLCAGKGVLVAGDPDEATAFLERSMDRREFGDAGSTILMEEALEGSELSYIILTDGTNFVPMLPAQDHKRAGEGDTGPNTGGMGAYTMDGLVSSALEAQIRDTIVKPTLTGLAKDGIAYNGFLYFGLMLTADGPKVLEFNCRLGDPEAQPILIRLESDFAALCLRAASRNLAEAICAWRAGASACVVMASGGYPGQYVTGKEVQGLPATSPAADGAAVVFHSGTKLESGRYYTSGGRVLGVAGYGLTLASALKVCYDTCSSIRFDGSFFRRDIGRRALARSA